MTAPQPVVFSQLRRPAAQWFKSAALILERREEDFSVPAAVLAEWICRHDAWLKDQCAMPAGRGLHHLYHRDVSVVGDAPLVLWDRLAEIGSACRGVGIGFSITVRATLYDAEREQLAALLATGAVSSVGVCLFADDQVTPERLSDLLHLLRASKVSLGLLGAVQHFRDLGVLNWTLVNHQSYTLYPLEDPGQSPPADHADTQACFSRFRVHIDTDGSMYPCLGLLGVAQARLGSVYDAVDRTVFGGHPTALSLKDLAERGPGLGGNAGYQRQSGLPMICERHRFSILAASP